MYIRKKKNRSGTTSVVVFDKRNGYRELHTVGVSSDPVEIERLCLKGKEWIDRHIGQHSLDFEEKASMRMQCCHFSRASVMS